MLLITIHPYVQPLPPSVPHLADLPAGRGRWHYCLEERAAGNSAGFKPAFHHGQLQLGQYLTRSDGTGGNPQSRAGRQPAAGRAEDSVYFAGR